MKNLKFEITNKELAVEFGGSVNTEGKITSSGELEDGKARCYVVDFSQKTSGGMIPVGFVQKLNNVPSRGAGANGAFEASNALADMFGTNTFEGASNIYRSRELVNEATAKVLVEKIGQPITKFELIVTDSFEPAYEGQSSSKNKDGEEKLSGGKPFYTSTNLAIAGTKQHSVVKVDTVTVETGEVISAFTAEKVF